MQQIEYSFKTERGNLLNYIKSRVSGIEDAEDILQDVFVQAVNNFNSLEPINNIGAWLFTVTKNKIIDWYRKKKIKTVSFDGDQEISLKSLIADSKINIEKEFIRSLVTEALVDAFEELPETQKDVFIKHAIEGKTFQEISGQTGVSLNTLLSRKRYAVMFLRKRLKELKKLLDEY